MIISHVKIIGIQTIIIHCLWIFYIARKDCSLYNKQNNTCVLGNTRFILLYNIYIIIAALTREISRTTLEIRLVFPRTCIILYILNNALQFKHY